jgi:hypothetical protein
MESKGSLLCSQEPATGPYPELDAFLPSILKTHSNTFLASMPTLSDWSLPLRLFQPKYCLHFSSLSRVLRVPPISFSLISTPVIFGESCNLWSSSFCSLLQPLATFSLLPSKYSPHHPVLKLPHLCPLWYSDRPSFTPLQNNRSNYGFVENAFLGYIF